MHNIGNLCLKMNGARAGAVGILLMGRFFPTAPLVHFHVCVRAGLMPLNYFRTDTIKSQRGFGLLLMHSQRIIPRQDTCTSACVQPQNKPPVTVRSGPDSTLWLGPERSKSAPLEEAHKHAAVPLFVWLIFTPVSDQSQRKSKQVFSYHDDRELTLRLSSPNLTHLVLSFRGP